MNNNLSQPALFSRSFQSGLPFLGLAALLLASGHSLEAQGAYVPPPPSTWQSSPVLTKFMTELRAPGLIPVAQPDGTRRFTGSTLTANHYTIEINQFKDQLHPSLPPTTLWGYNPTLALGVAPSAIVPQKHLGGIIIAQKGGPHPDHLPQQPARQAHPPCGHQHPGLGSQCDPEPHQHPPPRRAGALVQRRRPLRLL